MNYRQSLWFEFVDVNAQTASTSLHTQANPDPVFGVSQPVVDLTQSLSEAALRAVWRAPVALSTALPNAGPYASVFDKAIFTWRSAAGLIVRTVIPAPIDMFLADGKTVDLSNPVVAAYVAACQSALGDSGGNPLSTVLSAVRARYTPGGL